MVGLAETRHPKAYLLIGGRGRTCVLLIGMLFLSWGCGQKRPQAMAPKDVPPLQADAPPRAMDVAESVDKSRLREPPDSAGRPVPPAGVPTFLPAVDHLVAIGDLHGDLQATKNALRLAGAIGPDDHWIGGDLVVVQVGDQLDRGDDERAILLYLEELAIEAATVGGAVYPLLGNHETMNVDLYFGYVTAGGFTDFANTPYDPNDLFYTSFEPDQRGRVAAFRPGGPFAILLAQHNMIQVVGETAFVHGGLLPEHALYGLEAINRETQEWMRGERPRPPITEGANSPVWSRHYSQGPDIEDCLLLQQVLEMLELKRLVVAHTVQTVGITDACQGMVWRVDVGLAAYYGGTTAVLRIDYGVPTVVQAETAPGAQ